MSNSAQGVSALLNRFDKTFRKPAQNNDWKELKAMKEKYITKCHDGKNQFIFITPEGATDPFVEWGYHQGLQEVEYFAIPCEEHNKGEECIVCNLVHAQQKANFEGNKHIWLPIQKKIEFWAPVVNVTTATTIAEGPKWLKVSKSAMDQMIEWLKNLESDEVPFYDESDPQRVIFNYDANTKVFKDKYKLDKKNASALPAQQLADFKGALPAISTFFTSKTQEETKRLLETFLERIEEQTATSETSQESDELPFSNNEEVDAKVTSKLDSLKKK